MSNVTEMVTRLILTIATELFLLLSLHLLLDYDLLSLHLLLDYDLLLDYEY